MRQIQFRATQTTTVGLPDWAPDIRYASTGSGSGNVILTFATTTTKDEDDVLNPLVTDLVSYSARKIRLRNDILTKRPYVTFRYEAIGDLTR